MLYQEYYSEKTLPDGSIEAGLDYPDDFSFGWDVVARIAAEEPQKKALVWCNADGDERIFTFGDIDAASNRIANLLLSSGISRGDRVILVMKRHYGYWPAAIALHKIGAVMIPMTHMLTASDFAYRFAAARPKAIITAADEGVMGSILAGEAQAGASMLRWCWGKRHPSFRDIEEEMEASSPQLGRIHTLATDPMIIYFTSGTTGYPKGVIHDFSYPLAHIPTAKDWQKARDGGLHFTVAETGWAKASWGKIYGQWLVGAAVMAYDFDTFDPRQVASVINRYGVTSFCAPPTVYRYLARKGIPPMPTLEHASTAGEYLSPDIFRLFREKTGLKLHEGYGQTETVLLTADFQGDAAPGSMGRPSPLFDVRILRPDGSEASAGEIGEIAVIPKGGRKAAGIFSDYLGSSQLYSYAWRGGAYHTGDMAWKDDDGIFWFHGRGDDVIKSGGFRIGPGEIEDILSTHPAVMECSVVGVPDEARGQAVKAVVVPAPEGEPGHMLEREIREYCNARLAEYKWIRQVEFRDCLPKTISGKVRKAELR